MNHKINELDIKHKQFLKSQSIKKSIEKKERDRDNKIERFNDYNSHALWILIPLIILAGFLLWLWTAVEGGMFKDISFIITLIILIQLIVNLITQVKIGC